MTTTGGLPVLPSVFFTQWQGRDFLHLSQADKLSNKLNGVITNVLEPVLLTGMRINGAKLIKQSLLRILWPMDSEES